MNSISHVFSDLFRERTRILMTVLAIAWGTASITLMLAVGEGLRDMLGRAFRGMGSDLIVIRPRYTSIAYRGLPAGRPIPITPRDVSLAEAHVPEIGAQSPEYTVHRGMRAGENWRTGRVSGVWPEFGDLRNIIPLSGGRFINKLDLQQRRRVVVLGDQSAKELFPEGADPVGETVDIDGRPFRVIGVMRKKFQSASYYSPDRMGSWIPATTLQDLFDRPYPQYWIVQPRSPEAMDEMLTGIREVVARNHSADPTDEFIFSFWDTIEAFENGKTVLTGLKYVLGIVGGLTLVVAAVGVANIMYLSVRNATQEIGVRMAVGAKGRHIITPVVLESLLATAAGGCVGLLASAGMIELLDLIPAQMEFFEQVGKPIPLLSSSVAVTVIGVLGVVGLISGLYPARQAAHINPSEALRYE